MFCEYCGAKNNDGVKFCKNCGKPMAVIPSVQEPEKSIPVEQPDTPKKPDMTEVKKAEETGVKAEAAMTEAKGKLSALPKKVIYGAAAALAVLIALIILITSGSKTIDLNKYILVEDTGYNGYGHSAARIDWESLEEKYGSKLAFTKETKKTYGELLQFTPPMQVLRGSVSVETDPDSGLTNGDSVHYTIVVNEQDAAALDCKLKYKDGDHKVSGLEDVETFDAFANLEITYEGVSPNGYANFTYNGDEFSSGEFMTEENGGLRNGDTFTVTLRRSPESYAEDLGKVPAEMSKEYTVSGLNEYVESFGALSEDFISELKADAEDQIYAYTAGQYSAESPLSDLAYAGNIFGFEKENSGYYPNKLYLVYTGTVSHTEGDFRPTKVFFPVGYYNIVKHGDTFEAGEKAGIRGDSYLDGTYFFTSGYVNPINLMQELVTKDLDSYTFTLGDGFEKYDMRCDISALSDISEDFINELSQESIEKIESFIADRYTEGTSWTAPELKGSYLLVAKAQGNDFSKNNRLILVFETVISNSNGFWEPFTDLISVEYDGIVSLPDDEFMVSKTVGIMGADAGIFGLGEIPGTNGNYKTIGYPDGEGMFTDVVTKNRDNYKYEVSEGLRAYGE